MTDQTRPLDLDAIEAYCEAATPDWGFSAECEEIVVSGDSVYGTQVADFGFSADDEYRSTPEQIQADITFAVSARTDLPLLVAELREARETITALRTRLETAGRDTARSGIYVASRASVPERSAMWRSLQAGGVEINSSWIHEAGEGETSDFAELWTRIDAEIGRSQALVMYAERGDFPLKGALVEVGIAIGQKIPVILCLPGVELEGRTCRPVGSWIEHPLVTRIDDLRAAIDAAKEQA